MGGLKIATRGWATESRHEKRSGGAGRGTSAVCIVVGGRAIASRHVDGLQLTGTKSEVAAQVEAQVQCA